MAVGRWVQASLFDSPREQVTVRQQDGPPRRRGKRAARRRPNYVRVTRDARVALSSDQSSRLSAEVTWQFAQQLSEDRLEQLRRLVGRPAASVGTPQSNGR